MPLWDTDDDNDDNEWTWNRMTKQRFTTTNNIFIITLILIYTKNNTLIIFYTLNKYNTNIYYVGGFLI